MDVALIVLSTNPPKFSPVLKSVYSNVGKLKDGATESRFDFTVTEEERQSAAEFFGSSEFREVAGRLSANRN